MFVLLECGIFFNLILREKSLSGILTEKKKITYYVNT